MNYLVNIKFNIDSKAHIEVATSNSLTHRSEKRMKLILLMGISIVKSEDEEKLQ